MTVLSIFPHGIKYHERSCENERDSCEEQNGSALQIFIHLFSRILQFLFFKRNLLKTSEWTCVFGGTISHLKQAKTTARNIGLILNAVI